MGTFKIVSWNVGGLGKLLEKPQWKDKTFGDLVEELDADVLPLQEHQLEPGELAGRDDLTSLPGYDTYWAVDQRKGKGIQNHFGVGLVTKRASCVPIKVEEGLTDRFVRHLDAKDQIGGYPTPAQTGLTRDEIHKLDNEGRVLVADMGVFVLINLYAPNETNQNRFDFKNNFNKVLECRISNLINGGREVLVVGDLNVTATSFDTTDTSERREKKFNYHKHNYLPRLWFNAFVNGKNGKVIDVYRTLHPDEHGYTFGWLGKPPHARVDYFLATPGLLPFIKECTVLSDFGSDHRPICLELYESITGSDGRKISLWEAMDSGHDPNGPPPSAPKLNQGPARTAAGASAAASSSSSSKGKGKEEGAPPVQIKKAGGQQQLFFPKQSTPTGPVPKDTASADTNKRTTTDEAGSSKKRSKTTSPPPASSPPAASSMLQAHSQLIDPPVPPKSASDILDLTQDDEDEVVII